MTHVDMVREARAIVPPVGASVAIAVVDEGLKHRAAFLVHGRIRSAPVGPIFDKPREAGAFIDILNGVPASRPGQPDFARGAGSTAARRDTAGQPETPVGQNGGVSVQDPIAVPPAAVGVRTCVGCDKPLPAGARPNRRTHGPACRVAAHRRRDAENSPSPLSSGAPRTDVTVSARQRPFQVPTARAGARGDRLLRASARDAGPDPSPGDRSLPTLGLL